MVDHCDVTMRASAVVKVTNDTDRRLTLKVRDLEGCRMLKMEDILLSPTRVATLGDAVARTESIEEVHLSNLKGDERLVNRLVEDVARGARGMKKLKLYAIPLQDTDALFRAFDDNGTLETLTIMSDLGWTPAQLRRYADELLPHLEAYVASRRCTLKRLCIDGYQLNDDGINILVPKRFNSSTSIQWLTLRFCEITDTSVVTMVAPFLDQQHCLESINLTGNAITGMGAKTIADALRSNHSLHTLDLSYNSIGDDGVEALADALVAQEHLRQLDLSSNEITDAGVASVVKLLTRNKHLWRVELCSNPCISHEGWAEIINGFKANMTCVFASDLKQSNPFREALKHLLEQNRRFPEHARRFRDSSTIHVWPEALRQLSHRPSWTYEVLRNVVSWEHFHSTKEAALERRNGRRLSARRKQASKRQRR